MWYDGFRKSKRLPRRTWWDTSIPTVQALDGENSSSGRNKVASVLYLYTLIRVEHSLMIHWSISCYGLITNGWNCNESHQSGKSLNDSEVSAKRETCRWGMGSRKSRGLSVTTFQRVSKSCYLALAANGTLAGAFFRFECSRHVLLYSLKGSRIKESAL